MKKLLIIAVIFVSCTDRSDELNNDLRVFNSSLDKQIEQYKKDSLTRDFNFKMEVQRIKKK